MTEIAFLIDHQEVIPTLTQWFRIQWPAYYAGRREADIAQDFQAEARRNGIPLHLLAFADLPFNLKLKQPSPRPQYFSTDIAFHGLNI